MRKAIHKYRLLVEGKDDQHMVWNLAERLRLKETFEVVSKDSYEQLIDALPIELKSTNVLERLGVVVDADEGVERHWQAIRSVLGRSGFYSGLPRVLPIDGLICKPDDAEQLIVGVWIMPDNRLDGMLEDFVAYMIPDGDKLLPEVEAVLKNLESNKLNQYKLTHHAKARMHTWLAWQDEPGVPMGTAITKRVLSTDGELCSRFVGWLCRLFDCGKE